MNDPEHDVVCVIVQTLQRGIWADVIMDLLQLMLGPRLDLGHIFVGQSHLKQK